MTIGWTSDIVSDVSPESADADNIKALSGGDVLVTHVREMCQNSLDNADLNSKKPVIVDFRLVYLSTKLDLFTGLKEPLKWRENYWKNCPNEEKMNDIIKKALKGLSKDTTPTLITSDHNTTGMDGSTSKKIDTNWNAGFGNGYNKKKQASAGGLHGVGKDVAFLCSDFYVRIMGTTAKDTAYSMKAIGKIGKGLDNKGNYLNPKINFGLLQDNKVYPIIKGKTETGSFFEAILNIVKRTANDMGTDVITPGFNQLDNWVNRIKQAIITNFFIAILENKLVVNIIDNENEPIIINKDTFDKYVEELKQSINTNELKSHEKKQLQEQLQYLETYINPSKTEMFTIMNEENALQIYIKFDETYKRQIIGFRTGMLIGNFMKNPEKFSKNYKILAVVRGDNLSASIKLAEPPKHDAWSIKEINSIKNITEKNQTEAYFKQIKETISNFIKSFSPKIEDSIDPIEVAKFLPNDIDIAETGIFNNIMINKVTKNRSSSVTKTSTKTEDSNQNDNKIYLTTSDIEAFMCKQTEKNKYLISLKPYENQENLYLNLYAKCESGRDTDLVITLFKEQDTDISLPIIVKKNEEGEITESTVGPFSLQADKTLIFEATIDSDETLTTYLKISKEIIHE